MKKPTRIILDPKEMARICMNQPRVSKERAAYSINIQNGIKLKVGRRLDMVYDEADDLMRKGDIETLDFILRSSITYRDEDSLTVAIGWLTATLPMAKHPVIKRARRRLRKKIKKVLIDWGEDPQPTLQGL